MSGTDYYLTCIEWFLSCTACVVGSASTLITIFFDPYHHQSTLFLSEGMLVSVGTAIAEIVDANHLKYDYIIPKVDDPRIIHVVTNTLKNAIQIHLDKKMQ